MISKKQATFCYLGKGIERVDNDLCCPWPTDRRDDDGFCYPDSEFLDYCAFLDSLLNVSDGGVDDDL